MSHLSPANLNLPPAVQDALGFSDKNITPDDVADENELAREELTEPTTPDLPDELPDIESAKAKGISKDLEQAIKVFRKLTEEGVISAASLEEYERWWKLFKIFCVESKYVKKESDLDNYGKSYPTLLPIWICLWIMEKCDSVDAKTGAQRKGKPASYSTAQKMRAAISHKWARVYGVGMTAWGEHPLIPGVCLGNPSMSNEVSQYMISLRRRKTRAGETVISARAMQETIMLKLFLFNMAFRTKEIPIVVSNAQKDANPQWWAGYAIRMMLETIYITAFLCLLRFDEVLKIRWSNVTFENCPDAPGGIRLKILLPYRKTHQFGNVAPFYLYMNPDEPWLCPVCAWMRWGLLLEQKGGTMTGFAFRKKMGHLDFSLDGNDGLSYDSFVECFKNNMLDIEIDPRPYGTHSFRRGGCQYLALELRWPYRNICTWAGWSDNLDNPVTLFKYLLHFVDLPVMQREQYFNPNRRGKHCGACGRTCKCA